MSVFIIYVMLNVSARFWMYLFELHCPKHVVDRAEIARDSLSQHAFIWIMSDGTTKD